MCEAYENEYYINSENKCPKCQFESINGRYYDIYSNKENNIFNFENK